jgi:hypothetical protein
MTEDVRMLLNALAEIAGPLLEEEGHFPPSAAVVTVEGEINLLEITTDGGNGRDEPEDPEQQIEWFREAFREAAGNGAIRACAFSLDVRVTNPVTEEENDAILVSAEIEGGEAYEVFLPYAVGEDEVEILQPFAVQRDAVVFG